MINKTVRALRNLCRIKRINNMKNSKISYRTYVCSETVFEGLNVVKDKSSIISCNIGYASYLSSYCTIINTDVGKYCSIASNVKIISGNHPTNDYVSTHPLLYSARKYAGIQYVSKSSFKEYTYVLNTKNRFCVIGNDVWIGTSSMIMSGVTIGNGAIIAAGSIITKDIEPYAIVAGVPAKIVRYRFQKNDIKFLENLCWWNKEEEWIQKHINLFSDIRKLKSEISYSKQDDYAIDK